MKFKDTFKTSSRKINDSGFLSAKASFSRVGIQLYSTSIFDDDEEFPSSLRGTKVIRVLRPLDEVFNKESLETYKNTPVTDGHPIDGSVDSENVRILQVGMTIGDVSTGEGIVSGEVIVQDKTAIQKVLSGKEELSAGYNADIEFKSGKDPQFGEYDAIQRNIRVNHIAIVKSGRAGSSVRIADDADYNKENTNMITRKFNDVDVTFPDESSAEAFDGLLAKNKELTDASEANETVLTEKETLLVEKDELLVTKDKEINDKSDEMETLKGELEVEKALRLTPEQIDELVNKRILLVDQARSLSKDIEVTDLSDLDVKKAVITKVLGDEFDLKDKEVAFVDGVFTTLLNKEENTKESEVLAKSFDDSGVDDKSIETNKERYAKATATAWNSK